MAEQRRSGGSKKGVPHHPLAEALASDPNKPPERATKLFGFPGPAADAKSTRLWLDADLTSHIEIPNDAIIHSQTLDNDQGTILWVEPSATVTHSTTQSQDVQAEFLGGSIAEGNLGGVPGIPDWGSKLGTGPTRTFPCEPRILPTDLGPCVPTDFPCRVSVNIPCLSRDLPCQSVNRICATDQQLCGPVSDPRVCEPPVSILRCQTPPIVCHRVESVVRCPTDPIECLTPKVNASPLGPCVQSPGCPDPLGGDPIGPINPIERFR
jgi:hypothetical protein